MCLSISYIFCLSIYFFKIFLYFICPAGNPYQLGRPAPACSAGQFPRHGDWFRRANKKKAGTCHGGKNQPFKLRVPFFVFTSFIKSCQGFLDNFRRLIYTYLQRGKLRVCDITICINALGKKAINTSRQRLFFPVNINTRYASIRIFRIS